MFFPYYVYVARKGNKYVAYFGGVFYRDDRKSVHRRLYRGDQLETVALDRYLAELAEEMVDLAGREVALSKLAALPSTFWEDVIGKDILKDVTTGGRIDGVKLGQVVPTLPLDLKLILKHQVP